MTEKERIEQVMKYTGMNSAVFSSTIGIQGSTLSHILNGRNKPSLVILQNILTRFPKINPDWLILGKGTMERIIKQSSMPNLFESMDQTNQIEIELDTIPEKNQTALTHKQAEPTTESVESTQNENQNNYNQVITSVSERISEKSRNVEKIIIYFDDKTYQEFHP